MYQSTSCNIVPLVLWHAATSCVSRADAATKPAGLGQLNMVFQRSKRSLVGARTAFASPCARVFVSLHSGLMLAQMVEPNHAGHSKSARLSPVRPRLLLSDARHAETAAQHPQHVLNGHTLQHGAVAA